MSKTNWTVAYASVMGNLHVKEDIPCQDSCEYLPIGKNYGIAVVADGAGSSPNSHIGSRLAVKSATKYFKELVEEYKWFEKGILPEGASWQMKSIKAFRKVKKDLDDLAEKHEVNPMTLACTLIVVIHSPDALLVTHIGDGRAGYSNGKEWKAIINPYQGDEANETIFITSAIWEDDAVNKFIRSYIVKDEIKAFTLLTDGCEKGSFEVNLYDEEKDKYYDPNRPFAKFFNPNVKGLKMLRKDGKTQEEINELWSTFLEKGTTQFQKEIDDKTMILGVRNEEE